MKSRNVKSSKPPPIAMSSKPLRTKDSEQKDVDVLAVIDKALKHLNQMFESNMNFQDLYIELFKEKKKMKFDQIKRIYNTLTEGKAKELIFKKDKEGISTTEFNNHEGLVRVCWRSIEKLVKKITYYMLNENHLSVVAKSVLKMIHMNQQFVRRFQKVKSSSIFFILEIIELLVEENSILEKKIYDILLDRGYVVSLDEFYKLNGYGAEHNQNFYANSNTIEQENSQYSDNQEKDQQPSQIKIRESKKSAGKGNIRKKKNFKAVYRYSWRVHNSVQDDREEREQIPVNKTNFQIRQSFEKFIGDFLENQNLSQVIQNFEIEEQKSPLSKKIDQKRSSEINAEGLMKKKIFQNKIDSVLGQLKKKNHKMSLKILEFIDSGSLQAVSSKPGTVEKNNFRSEFSNESIKRQSSLSISQKKNRQSQMITNRKIINENFFKELLRRSSSYENVLTQQALIDQASLKEELLKPSRGVIPNVLEFEKQQPTHNISKNKMASRGKGNHFNANLSSKVSVVEKKFGSNNNSKVNQQNEVFFKKGLGLNFPDSKQHFLSSKIGTIREEEEIKENKSLLDQIEKSVTLKHIPIRFSDQQSNIGTKKSKYTKNRISQILQNNKIKEQMQNFQEINLNQGNFKTWHNFEQNAQKQNVRCPLYLTKKSQSYRWKNTQSQLNNQRKLRKFQNCGKFTKKNVRRCNTQTSPGKKSATCKNKPVLDSHCYRVYDRRLRRFV